VRKRHVAHAHVVVRPKCTERVLDRMATFHAEHGGNASAPESTFHVAGGECELEHIRVVPDYLVGNVNLLELHSCSTFLHRAGRDVHAPELAAHHSLAQSGDVRVTGGCAGEVVSTHVAPRFLAYGPRKVVVSVNQRSFGEQALYAFRLAATLRQHDGWSDHEYERQGNGSEQRHLISLLESFRTAETSGMPDTQYM